MSARSADVSRSAKHPSFWNRDTLIALLAILAIGAHLGLVQSLGRIALIERVQVSDVPLLVALGVGGLPLVFELIAKALKREFGSDLLAGISIVTAVLLGEYLAGTLVVLMLSGGQALEAYAVRSASSVLSALAKRMPSVAHIKRGQEIGDAALDEVEVGDLAVIFPHEVCPVDGVVIEGRSVMDESYLTGEPYMISKVPGSEVLSGSINGSGALTIRATKLAVDSRYSKIMHVMRESEQRRPALRRIADQLGAWYTPLAVGIAVAAWVATAEPTRFLAVLVVATPCPLLIAIPTAIIGSISLAARRGIIIKDPAVLEKLDTCRVAIFDKTGTLTYGAPEITEILPAPDQGETKLLQLVASLERYSKHPLSRAVLDDANRKGIELIEATEISEPPGQGLQGIIDKVAVEVTSRKRVLADEPGLVLPQLSGGLECAVRIDGRYAGLIRFRDRPREEGRAFIRHLGPRHGFARVMLVSGDRESEVRYLADKVGIGEVLASQSPEQKLDLVREETSRANTVFMGDGINDAPALTAATVGIAFGQASDVTSEAAGAVVLESSLQKVDELLHIGRRMRRIALQSALGGMALSVLGMGFAAFGMLAPVAGALAQELIDVLAVLNALRASFQPSELTDY